MLMWINAGCDVGLGFAQVPSHAPDVGFGSKADLTAARLDFRFTPDNGHAAATLRCRIWQTSHSSPPAMAS